MFRSLRNVEQHVIGIHSTSTRVIHTGTEKSQQEKKYKAYVKQERLTNGALATLIN